MDFSDAESGKIDLTIVTVRANVAIQFPLNSASATPVHNGVMGKLLIRFGALRDLNLVPLQTTLHLQHRVFT